MKSDKIKRIISVLLSMLVVSGSSLMVPVAVNAAVLQDGYEDEFEEQGKTYQNMGILEDQYDLIEPVNNRFPVISSSSKYDASYPALFTGTYEEVEDYFRKNGMTDGMPVVPPTKVKAEKFLGYSSYGFNDVVATVNGRQVKAYQVAANAIMAGCSPEHLPVCIAFTEALSDSKYLNSLRSGRLTPMMYVNGPVARQIGIDNTQGMTTEECNISIGRFMELALINLAGIKRTDAFGNVQPLVFSENDEVCLNIGWKPHHVEKGYDLNDNVITATSFSMWGNNVTPATDLPEEIMKIIAWDITEKNLGGLGSASVDDNANTRRLIFITESVATALATKYKTKADLESALVENARRPLWMRAYAYYYANTGGALSKSFGEVYNELKSNEKEDAKKTASPAWMNGITYADIDTVATMTKGNTDIIVTGDSSRNKTQVMPGGVSVSKTIKLSDRWDSLVTSVNYTPISTFILSEQDHTIVPPGDLSSIIPDGTYRILDPTNGSTVSQRAGRIYFDQGTNTLHYYAQGASSDDSIVLDPDRDASLISYLTILGANSSITVSGGKINDVVLRFSVIAQKLNKNTVALTDESFKGMNLTLHANSTTGNNINTVGGLAKDGASVDMSATVTSFDVNLDGEIIAGDTTEDGFVTLNGSKVTVDPTVKAGATAVIGSANDDGTHRTMTFVNGGDGTYSVTYNTSNTLSLTDAAVFLEGSFNNWDTTDAFEKTGNDDILTLTKDLPAGTYEFKIYKPGTGEYFGYNAAITDSAERIAMSTSGTNCTLNASGGTYEFKYELSLNKLSVYYSAPEIYVELPLTNTSTINSDRLSLGQRVYYTGSAQGGTAPYTYSYFYKRESGTIWKTLGKENTTMTLIAFAPTALDTYDIKITVTDADGNTADKLFKVTVVDGKSKAFVNNSTISTTGGRLGTKVKLFASATGSEGYTYAYYYKRTTARLWKVLDDEFGSETRAQFTPTDVGEFNVRIDVKDKNGEIVSQNFAVSISDDYVDTTTVLEVSADRSSAPAGSRITVTANASGGTAPYQYAFYYRRAEGISWNLIGTGYSDTSTASVKFNTPGDIIFKVCVKDADGGMTSKNIDVTVE